MGCAKGISSRFGLLVRALWPHGVGHMQPERFQLGVYVVMVFAYSAIAFRRFYRVRWWQCAAAAAVFAFFHAEIIFTVYRFLLFETTMVFL